MAANRFWSQQFNLSKACMITNRLATMSEFQTPGESGLEDRGSRETWCRPRATFAWSDWYWQWLSFGQTNQSIEGLLQLGCQNTKLCHLWTGHWSCVACWPAHGSMAQTVGILPDFETRNPFYSALCWEKTDYYSFAEMIHISDVLSFYLDLV